MMGMDASTSEMDELWSVFGDESKENLELIEQLLLKLEGGAGEEELIAALFRAMHTLKGGARMMGLVAIEQLAHRAEDIASQARDEHIPLDGAALNLLLEVTDCLCLLLEQALAQRQDVADERAAPLAARLEALAQARRQAGAPPQGSQPPDASAAPPPPAQTHTGPAPEAEDVEGGELLAIDELPAADPLPPTGERSAAGDPLADADAAGAALTNPALIDLAEDPVSRRIFFEMAEDEANHLRASLAAWDGGDDTQSEHILSTADTIAYAAGQMGFVRLQRAAQDLLERFQASRPRDARQSQAEIASLAQALLDELQALQNRCDSVTHEPPSNAAPLEQPGEENAPPAGQTDELSPQGAGGVVSGEQVRRLLQIIGEAIGDQAALHRVAARLEQKDLARTAMRIIRDHPADVNAACQELEALFNGWQEEIVALARAEASLGASLRRLQEAAQAMRLAPLSGVISPLRSQMENLACQQGKRIAIRFGGGELLIDQGVLDALEEPLNSLAWLIVSESIETPQERQAAGKTLPATISIAFQRQEDALRVVVEEDGRGLGSHPELAAIRAELGARQGVIEQEALPAGGDRFTLRLPLDSTIVDGLALRAGNYSYLAPLGAVRRIVWANENDLVRSSADGAQVFYPLDDQLAPVISLGHPSSAAERLMVIIENGRRCLALEVDELLGQLQTLVLPLEGALSQVRGASGCFLLGDGGVGLVLNPAALESAPSSQMPT